MRPKLVIGAALAAILWNAWAMADDTAKPSVEVRVLERLVGTWAEEMSNKPTDWTPKAETARAVTRRSWSLGRKFVRGEGRWQPSGTEYLNMVAFDADAKVFRNWYFDSTGGMPRGSATGRWDEATTTITWRGTDEGGNRLAGTHRFIDQDRHDWTYTVTSPAGRTLLDLSGKCVRTKE